MIQCYKKKSKLRIKLAIKLNVLNNKIKKKIINRYSENDRKDKQSVNIDMNSQYKMILATTSLKKNFQEGKRAISDRN